MTTDTDQQQTPGGPPPEAGPPTRGRARVGLFVLVSAFLLVLVAAGALLAITGGEVRMPGWMVARIEARINMSLPGGSQLKLGQIEVRFFDQGFNPVIVLEDVGLLDADGVLRARLPQVETALDSVALGQGRLRPTALRTSGAEVKLRREADGSIDVNFSGASAADLAAGDPAAGVRRDLDQIIAEAERLFAGPVLGGIETIESTGMRLVLDDALTGRVWRINDGKLTIRNGPELTAALSLRLEQPGRAAPAQAVVSLVHPRGAATTRVQVQLMNAPAADIAQQSAALNWLSLLDAPISGALAMEVAREGRFRALHGTLEIGAGSLRTVEGAKPTRFDRAKVYFSFDETRDRLTFDAFSLQTGALSVDGAGHADLAERDGRRVGALIGQFAFSRLRLDLPEIFAEPVEFNGGAIDMRIGLEPLRVDLGQLVLTEQQSKYILSGSVSATPEGWVSALDLAVPSLSGARLLALWPHSYKPPTREWIETNIDSGTLHDINGALRHQEGTAPRFEVTFDFDGLAGRYLRDMPPVREAAGHGALNHRNLTLAFESGQVTPPQGGQIEIAGSTFHIPDITIPGPPAEVALSAEGPVEAVLSLIDQPPFGFLQKAGLSPDLAQGRAQVVARLELPLRKQVGMDDVRFTAEAAIAGARSAVLVPGKLLSAPALSVRVDGEGISVSGKGALGKVGVEGAWTQKFGPAHSGRSRIEGTVELGQAFVDEFGIGLPPGSVAGAGLGSVTLDLARGTAPEFTLVSDLNRVVLRIPALGWQKPAAARGRLEVAGHLGSPPAIDRLDLEVAGLTAAGEVRLRADGSLEAARLSRVRLGGWLDVGVVLEGQGKGRAARIRVDGGTLDLRRAEFGSGSGGDPARLDVRLDRLIVSQGIALTGLAGEITTGRGLNGQMRGMVNGATPVTATLAPVPGGTGIRLRSDDAGAVLRAAGIFSGARGGAFDMTLRPLGPPRTYDGTIAITETRVRDAPSMAALLSAVSVVGLLEQLGGEGLFFSNVDGDLTIAPDTITLRRGSATGPSMGLSLDGRYDVASARLDMQGVVTPIYMLNGVLQQTNLFGGLFGRTRGEGLFGFSYRLSGSAASPDVSVNPLSVLAPGVLREIFRRQPQAFPEVREEG